ncbi:hypothetical protein R6Q59_003031 [Mikania micrantha]
MARKVRSSGHKLRQVRLVASGSQRFTYAQGNHEGSEGHQIKKRVEANEGKDQSKDELVEQISRKKRKQRNGTPKKKIEALKSSKYGKDKVDKYPIIFNRCSPKQLIRALKKLSTKQKEKVRKIGFGGILSLQVDRTPQRLGYFVADKFDERSMEIKLPCGTIKVDGSSLSRLLGITNSGCNLLDVEPNKPLNPRILEWRDSYKSEYIAATEIVKRIICNGDDDSFDFVLNFLVLFIATMVECHSYGKCKLEILEYFTADTDFKDINCVTLDGMNVDHKIPAVAFWDLERLKERENMEICRGSFGKGTYV